MNTIDILTVLKLATDLDGLESLLTRLIALNITTEELFAFAREHKVSVTLAASVLIIAATLNTPAVIVPVIDPRWTRQIVTAIKHYTSGSGNPTWRCTLESGGEVYIRQSNKQAWIEAGFSAIERMTLNATWDADIVIYTLPGEKNFLDVQRVEGGTLTESTDTRVADASNTAWEWLNTDNIYMLDFETTGLGEDAQIVSYCVRDARCNILGSGVVKPTIEIPQAATAIHGITNDDVKDALPLHQCTIDGFILPDFMNRFSDRIVTWNASFDARVYRQSMTALGFDVVLPDWRCAMTLYSEAFGTWNARRNQYDYVSLEKAAKAEAVTYTAHSAIEDTLAAVQVLDALARRSLPF